jgi:hypothetical protein
MIIYLICQRGIIVKNMDFNKINYDYYSNTSSYIKMILEVLPESMVSTGKKQVVKELFNFYMNRFGEEKIKEISAISSMFREKIAVSNLDDIARHVEFLYVTFIEGIIYDSANREMLFDTLNETMKAYVGYYQRFNYDGVYDNYAETHYAI